MLSATLEMLTDVGWQPNGYDSNPSNFVTVGALTYFTATPQYKTQPELWVTDGTPNGTRLFKELMPSNLQINASKVQNIDGTLYFGARDAGTSLYWNWKWDGAGTTPAPVLSAAGTNVAMSAAVEANGVWYFAGQMFGDGLELWRTDGTQAGTYRVKDVRPGSQGGLTQATLYNVNGTLFFSANDGTHGSELWKSDGTEAGTVMVKDINAGTSAGLVQSTLYGQMATVVGDVFYFSATAQGAGTELWRSDGTEAGTFQVKDIYPGQVGSAPQHLTNVGGTLFFTADDSVNGKELWKSDGSQAGTVLVKNIETNINDPGPFDLTEMNGVLYFASADRLWRSDGTSAGTTRLEANFPGSDLRSVRPVSALNQTYANLDSIHNLNGTLYFLGREYAPSDPVVWRSDGSSAGVSRLVPSIPSDAHSPRYSSVQTIAVAGAKLFFAANSIFGNEPWISDGTEAGTRLLSDLTSMGSSSGPSMPLDVDGTPFFIASSSLRSTTPRIGVWVTEGSRVSTRLVAELPSDITTARAIGHANGLYFFQATGDASTGLWRSDGTAAGTFKLKSMSAGAKSAQLDFAELDGVLYFGGGGANNYELWRSDGTEVGTYLVADLNATGGLNSGFPLQITRLNEAIYFSVSSGATRGLWRSDGTANGTNLVQAFNGAEPQYMLRGGDTLYFAASGNLSGFMLWKSDGTADGTVPVRTSGPYAEIRRIGLYPNYSQLAYMGGEVYFVANDSLWKSDGTDAGTVMLKDIRPDGTAFAPGEHPMLVVAGSNVYFAANDGTHGYELWKSDGTPEGTEMVADLRPGSSSNMFSESGYIEAVDMGDKLYFAGSVNSELWVTDGTAAGTMIAADVRPGQYASDPRGLTNVGGRLYFTADDSTHGRELWAFTPGPEVVEPLAGDYNSDGRVDGADFLAWQRGFGGVATPAGSGADGDSDGTIGAGDLDVWEGSFSAPAIVANKEVPASNAPASIAAPLMASEEFEDDALDSEVTQTTARDRIFAAGDFSRLYAVENESDVFRDRWRKRR